MGMLLATRPSFGIPDKLRMRCDGVAGAHTFTQEGSSTSAITSNNATNFVINATGQKEGNGWLTQASASLTDWVGTSGATVGMIPKSASWFIGAYLTYNGTANHPLLSIDSATVNDRVFLFYSLAGLAKAFFYDTTAVQIVTAIATTFTLTAGHTDYWAVANKAGTLYFSINGTIQNVGGTAFAGTGLLKQSATAVFRLGAEPNDATGGAFQMDLCQIIDGDARYGSSNFTPPVTPI